jgi:hypothetical protein
MILFDDHNNIDFDALALDHYNNRNRIKADGVTYRSNALITRIRNRRDEDNLSGNSAAVRFWNYLLENNFERLRQLIVGRPNQLNALIEEIIDRFGGNTFSRETNYNNASLTEFGNVIKKVFDYEGFRKSDWCRELFSNFNLIYCPYCNEQTIQNLERISGETGDIKRLMLLQLDHFYPQSRHPYLSLSFFNLIPGCSNCNAILKREKRFSIDTHFNPYHKRLDDYFTFQLDPAFLNSREDVSLSYFNKSEHEELALGDFRILERYTNSTAHKRMIFNLFNSLRNHSNKVRISLRQQFFNLFLDSEATTKRLIETNNIPEYQREINEVQLGKLKRDIAIQLGVINP